MGSELTGPLARRGQFPQPLLGGEKMQKKKAPLSRGESLLQLPLLLNSP